MAASRGRSGLGDREFAERLLAILVNAAEGRRSISDDRQYATMRREFGKRGLPTPRVISTHPTVDSFAAAIKGRDRKESVEAVQHDFTPVFREIGMPPTTDDTISSSDWTGQPDRVTQIRVVQRLLPLAQSAVDSLIDTLAEPSANGGPILDEREEALRHLRALHSKLGELLAAIDTGHFDDELGQSLAAEAARYAKRAAKALRDDPMPYLASALLLGIFEACGFPGIAGYLTGVALNVKKSIKRTPSE